MSGTITATNKLMEPYREQFNLRHLLLDDGLVFKTKLSVFETAHV